MFKKISLISEKNNVIFCIEANPRLSETVFDPDIDNGSL